MKFKVGDRVKQIESGWHTAPEDIGKCAVVTACGGKYADKPAIKIKGEGFSLNDDKWRGEYAFEKIGEPMTPRQRIEALENGWDKNADDILQEIVGNNWVEVAVRKTDIKVRLYPTIGVSKSVKETFCFTSQCAKMQAFKDAWLWLLDKSGIEKAEKRRGEIEELKEKVREIEHRIKDMEEV